MYFQFDVLRISTCLYLISVLNIFSIHSAELYKSKYILPVLPETPYTLNDVIILPENTNIVETKIISRPTSTVIATLNLTSETSFRLGYGIALQNASLESGLQIVTTSKTTLVIELATGLLKLSSVDDYGHIYHIFALKDNFGGNQETNLLIQSSVPDTSISLCVLYNEEDKMINNFAKYSQEIPKTTNCSRKKVPDFDGFLLNNISMLPGIEITSEHPISILEGHLNHMLPMDNTEPNFNNSDIPFSPISWYTIPPFTNRSNQFVLIPNQDKREVELWIVSPVNSSVEFFTSGGSIRHNLTEKRPFNISMTIEPGSTFIVAGKNIFSLSCFNANKTDCDNDILPLNINVAGMDNDSSLNNGSQYEEYQWIYISNDTTVLIMCPLNIDINVCSLNGTFETAEEIHLNVSNVVLKMKYFPNSHSGVYRISLNSTLGMCDILYLQKVRLREFDTDISWNESTLETNVPSSFANVLSMSANASSNSTSNGTSYFSINTYSSKEKTAEEDNTSTKKSISPYKKTSGVGFAEGKLQNKSASFLQPEEHLNANTFVTSTLFKVTSYSAQDKLTTQNDNKVPGKDNQKINEVFEKSNSNQRFKAVVDILHSKNGSKNILNSKSDKRNNPKYTYTIDVNDNYGLEGDGKDPVAIIASLVTAILAVGAIILVFLLKEVFSRRKQMRKTRIRPFISYY
ncbi:uncharacterized protein LOC123537173 [Mercenaria mercenaria]|uniref:uncharacterized protein LOC123537173 n=1 Tax=Mercenaria mercenaria TaxID=6596 RepID=UPI00234F4196|nr:uncharacterized protein LOC123537173 [Mercenaria mercenaria]